MVTSYTEVWIEIIIVIKSAQAEVVTSYTEVWIVNTFQDRALNSI